VTTPSIDLDAYFQRIGHDGDRAPTLETLRALQLRHAQTIPYETVNTLLGLPVHLDPSSLQRKLIQDRRGGYCYEQNLLLQDVLRALGFATTGLEARVLWNAPEGETRARTHMLMRVDLEETPYIVDIGFGARCPTAPLRLVADVEQDTPHGSFRLIRAKDDFILECELRDGWAPLYRFDLQAQERIDYEVANWYVSAHPRSSFIGQLLVALAEPGRRHTLRGNELATHYPDRETDRRLLTTPAEIHEALETIFEINLDGLPNLDTALARLCEPGD